MDEQSKLLKAKELFRVLCDTLDKDDWRYKKNEEELTVECGARGEDLPMELVIHVDAERSVVFLISHIPFRISEDKRLDAAIAVCVVNEMLVHGAFDFDIADGQLLFRITNSFLDSTLGGEALRYMLYCACTTVDEYNDKFFMLSKGIMSLEKFIEAAKN